MEAEWVQYTDDSGAPYWYNAATDESTYAAPEGVNGQEQTGQEFGGGYDTGYGDGDGGYEASFGYDSTAYNSDYDSAGAYGSDYDAEFYGSDYDSGWDSDAGGATQGGAAGREWQEFADDEGWPYWYNTSTGESTYENPSPAGEGSWEDL